MKGKKRVSQSRKPARGKIASLRAAGRKMADLGVAGRKVVGRRIASLRASGDQTSGDEELQPSVTADSRAWGRPRKKRITLFLDADVLAWFKESGPKYQRSINWALREVMEKEKKESGK